MSRPPTLDEIISRFNKMGTREIAEYHFEGVHLLEQATRLSDKLAKVVECIEENKDSLSLDFLLDIDEILKG